MIEPSVLRSVSAVLLLCAASIPASAWAWGSEGHQTVALIADDLLTTRARDRVAAILSEEPGATLASISNWADETRRPDTAPWHYVNLPRDADCIYSPPRDCPTGNCVVAALRNQVGRLANGGTPSGRLEALKYVVHFVGDIHQPLHAAFADDRGGNSYQLQAFGRGTSLHAVWDTALLADIAPRAEDLADIVRRLPSPIASITFDPERWAQESCRIASQPEFYPGRRLDRTYIKTYEQLALVRLQLAALRLATILNATFAE